MPYRPNKTSKWPIALMSISAMILAIAFTGRGLYLLGIAEQKPNDLALRWREVKYIYTGINPYDISDYLYRNESGLPPPARPAMIDPKLGGTPVASGYPPWAFFWAIPFIPPVDWGWARAWFFALNVISLGFLGILAWRATAPCSPMLRTFPVACVFSMNAVGTTLGNGQWGIILCALLAATSISRRRGATMIPSLFYAASFLKPTFSFTHAATFRKRKDWVVVLLAGLFTAISWIIVSWHVNIGPLEMLQQMLDQTTRWNDISYSIPDALEGIGAPRNLAMIACLATGLIAATCILRMKQREQMDPLYELAVCATLARIMAYHQLYDNMLMIFLVIAIARLALLRSRPVDLAVIFTLLVSLWIPGRFTSLFAIQVFQMVIWISALGWLIKCDSDAADEDHETDSRPLNNLIT